MFQPVYLLAILLFLSTAFADTCLGQAAGTGGTIVGSVTDPSGAVVAGADVVLTNPITGYSQHLKSAPDGTFRLVNIPFNSYILTINAPGFQPFKQTLAIRSAVPTQVTASLELASATQSVTVEATPEQVLEDNPSSHTDADQSLLSKLPSTGTAQGLSQALTLTNGGVVADSNGFFHPQGDHGETSYVVDGQTIGDQQSKTFSTQIPSNAFQSIEAITSAPNAEYGDKTSMVVNATTRSGLGQRPSASLETYYGSFGTFGENATLGVGGSNWGNFLVLDSDRSGRFLDSPEFTPFHDKGNNETIFDRIDYQPSSRDALHLNIFGARNWFQIPDTYDQLDQDQRQQARTFSFALGYQHTFNANTVLTIDPSIRQDRVNYYPSNDPFNDTPATISQDRHLTDWGVRAELSYASGIHNIKIGTELTQTRLVENFGLGITDPAFNPFCLSVNGGAITVPSITNTNQCAAIGATVNPNFSPGLLPFDLTRGGTLFEFHGRANIDQQAIYAQDQITIKQLTLNLGLRFDDYEGISSDNLLQPRTGIAYLIRRTGTVVRGSYSRTMETPYNENLVLSSTTGAGGLASNVFGAYGAQAIRPGHRNQFDVGLQQSAGKLIQIDADYFWKYTKNAFDFDTLFNTPIAFPIEWRESKIDGVSARISTTNIHGFQAYTTLGHTRSRFFGPEIGGIIFNSPLDTGVFRIDHDQAFQQTTYLRYQYKKNGPWAAFTWRFDSGEVAGSVTGLADALALDADQQAAIGFYCGNQVATVVQKISSCSENYGATRIDIPAPGTYNPDHNPPRIAPRNLFDVEVGTDNLFNREKGLRTTLKFTVLNVTDKEALYNFLSTFSGTHFVEPRSYQVSLGWVL
ncbi:MAG TPA: TonB-dependent receptor [Bryobacteraceae bacterium]|nr:TonB-dependent receptor [Bryobacteraceae bacterium]